MRTADVAPQPWGNRPSQLEIETQLQAVLQTETSLQPPIEIHCRLQPDLLVIAQHRVALPNPRSILTLLERAIRALPDAVGLQHPLPVRLYLRVIGQQPYASHEFTLNRPDAPPGQIVPLAGAIAPAEPPAETEDPTPQPSQAARLPRSVWIVGAIVAITAFGGSLYALTRPCVLGECLPLQRAEQLNRTAIETTQNTRSAEAILTAYDQLVEANYLLGTIPPWSQQHDIAQTRLQQYSSQTASLEQIVSALRLAQTAAQRSQNPPHPFTEWQAIQGIWQQAIDRLSAIPADSSVYALAQRKLAEYRASRASIAQRIAIERQAQDQVNTARSAARIAQARQGVATDAEGWQLAHATWISVVNVLQQVPQTTMARAEAQQLLAIYQPQLAAARDRSTTEGISANAYNQAIQLASLAGVAERQKQWSQAVDQWRGALTNAQQVPSNTSYYSQAQPLVAAYTAALSRSQDILRVTMGMQSAAADLNRTCANTPKICDYSFGEKTIRVRITREYDRAVEQAMVRSPAANSDSAQVAAHVNTLLRALAAIGENANIAIELYNADGSLFGTYVPQFSGYVAK